MLVGLWKAGMMAKDLTKQRQWTQNLMQLAFKNLAVVLLHADCCL
jgi:hypothetical protein